MEKRNGRREGCVEMYGGMVEGRVRIYGRRKRR